MTDQLPPTRVLDVARDQLRIARRELVDERAAFDQFCKRAERIPVDGAGTTAPPDAACATALRPADDGLAAVRRAYESTVMAVPHYPVAYGDPYSTHLAAELGGELARSLRHATRLTPQLRARLVDAANTARERRVDRISAIDAESATLDRTGRLAVDLLDALTAGENSERRAHVDDIERRCRAHVRDRQSVLDDSTGLLATVYEDDPGVDPVLLTLETVLARVAEWTAKRSESD